MKRFLKNLFSKKPFKKQWSKVIEYDDNKNWEEKQEGFYQEGEVKFNLTFLFEMVRDKFKKKP